MPHRAALLPALVLTSLMLAGPGSAEAQSSIQIEARAGVTVPTGDLSDADYDGGLALALEALYPLHRNVAAYASLARHTFECDADCGLGADPRSSGVGAGLKLTIPSPADALLWVRGGLLGYSFSDETGSGDRSIGYEAGAGIDMLLTPSVYLTPHLGYLAHEAIGGLDATFLIFGFGVQYRFGQ